MGDYLLDGSSHPCVVWAGQDQVGRTNGEVMLWRWRPYLFYCIDNCLYEIEMGFDMNGFGNGNAKNSTSIATGSILHRGIVHFHHGYSENPCGVLSGNAFAEE